MSANTVTCTWKTTLGTSITVGLEGIVATGSESFAFDTGVGELTLSIVAPGTVDTTFGSGDLGAQSPGDAPTELSFVITTSDVTPEYLDDGTWQPATAPIEVTVDTGQIHSVSLSASFSTSFTNLDDCSN